MDTLIKQKLAEENLKEIIKLFESPHNIKYVGKRMYVRCWFHEEKTPSMHVQEHSFYCFGCGAKGGIKKILEKVLPFEELTLVLEEYINGKNFKGASQINTDLSLNLKTIDKKIVMLAHDLLILGNNPNIVKVRNYLTEQRKINLSLIDYPIGYYNKGLFFPQVIYSDVISKSFNIHQSLPIVLGGKVRLIGNNRKTALRWISLQGTKESIPYEIKVSESPVLAITEGLTDALALTQLCNIHELDWHVIAAASILQMKTIVFNPYLVQKKQMLIVFTDEDNAGIKEREKIREIASTKNMSKIFLPSIAPFKDVAEILQNDSLEFPNLITKSIKQSKNTIKYNPLEFKHKNEKKYIKITPFKSFF